MAVNFKQIKNESLATIDAALTILNRFPQLDDLGNINLSGNMSLDPFQYILDILKHTIGINEVINILSKYIAFSLPALEIAVKGVILSELKDILSCSINPHMTDKILYDGVIIPLDEIDICNTLKYSPLDDKVGKNYYFDCEQINAETIDDLKNSKDLDAVLWYTINKSNRRCSWRINQGAELNQQNVTDGDTDSQNRVVCTLEFVEHAESLCNAIGKTIEYQTPYNRLIQVFIGNALENDSDEKIKELNATEQEEKQIQKQIKDNNDQIKSLNGKIEEKNQELQNAENRFKKGEISSGDYNDQKRILEKQRTKLQQDLNAATQNTKNLNEKKKKSLNKISKIKKDIKTILTKDATIEQGRQMFQDIKENFYAGKALVQFNIDYIKSVKFFDKKVVVARLLDAITGLLTIDLNLSYRQQLVREEIKKLVSQIIETDDITISDCFFNFSDKQYDEMFRQAELRKAGLLSLDGNEVSAVKINAEEILSSLNTINENSSKETIQSVINGTLTSISKSLSSTNYKTTQEIDAHAEINIIEKFIHELAYVLVNTIFSPKVFLLLLINLKLMGENTNLTIEAFIEKFNGLISSLIRRIRDHLIQYLTDEIMSRIKNLAEQIGIQFAIEQAKYYQRLIKKIIDCFKFNNGANDNFTIDNVDYADIYEQLSPPNNEEC